MKNYATILILIMAGFFWSQAGECQTIFSLLKSLQNQADEKFEAGLYLQAIPDYINLIKKRPDNKESTIRLAHCYFFTRQYSKAIDQYERISGGTNTLSYQDLYRLAEAYTVMQQYTSAIDCYSQILKVDTDNEVVLKKIWQLRNIQYLYEDSVRSYVRPLVIPMSGSEISPTQFQNRLIFASNSDASGIVENINMKTNAPFYKLYSVEPMPDSIQRGDTLLFQRPIPFGKDLKERYNIGPVAFFNDNTSMVYVATSKEANLKGDRTLGLHFATLENEVWVRTSSFPYNNDSYSIGDVTITEDGTQLYFSSDMKGGIGMSDIYVSTLQNGEWMRPQNLGEPINTSQNEFFPFIHRDGILYFSSDGHPGLGGLDIFKISIPDSTNEGPQNLGFPMNSNHDDFGIYVDSTSGHGFFSSNRKNGGYDDDLFEFNTDIQIYPFTITGVLLVKDHPWSDPSSIRVWPDKQVVLVDSNKNSVVVEARTDSEGYFSITIPYFSKYFIQVIDESGVSYRASFDIQKYRVQDTEHEIVIIKDLYSKSGE